MTKRVLSGLMAAMFVVTTMALVGCGEEPASQPGVTKPATKEAPKSDSAPASATKPS